MDLRFTGIAGVFNAVIGRKDLQVFLSHYVTGPKVRELIIMEIERKWIVKNWPQETDSLPLLKEELMPPMHAVEASEGGHTAPFKPHTLPQVGRFLQNNHNFTKNIWRFPKNNVPLQPDSAKWHKILGLVAQLVRATDS